VCDGERRRPRGALRQVRVLSPNKEADIVMIRTDHFNLYPSSNAYCTVLPAADIKNVNTVIIDGVIRKLGGKMLGVNWGEAARAN
jgi:5-methylthioadenosine/S-adenosylhomocysteine deaminase